MKTILTAIALVAMTSTGALAIGKYNVNEKDNADWSYKQKLCNLTIEARGEADYNRFALYNTLTRIEEGRGFIPKKKLYQRLDDIREQYSVWWSYVEQAADYTKTAGLEADDEKTLACSVSINSHKAFEYNYGWETTPKAILNVLQQYEDRIDALYKWKK